MYKKKIALSIMEIAAMIFLVSCGNKDNTDNVDKQQVEESQKDRFERLEAPEIESIEDSTAAYTTETEEGVPEVYHIDGYDDMYNGFNVYRDDVEREDEINIENPTETPDDYYNVTEEFEYKTYYTNDNAAGAKYKALAIEARTETYDIYFDESMPKEMSLALYRYISEKGLEINDICYEAPDGIDSYRAIIYLSDETFYGVSDIEGEAMVYYMYSLEGHDHDYVHDVYIPELESDT